MSLFSVHLEAEFAPEFKIKCNFIQIKLLLAKFFSNFNLHILDLYSIRFFLRINNKSLTFNGAPKGEPLEIKPPLPTNFLLYIS